jgi:hypothetical protein
MVSKGVSITIRGQKAKKGRKKMGDGKMGKTSWQPKGFVVTIVTWQLNLVTI